MVSTIAKYAGIATAALALVGPARTASSQQPPPGAGGGQPPAQGQRGRGQFRGPQPIPFEEHAGYQSIFDGVSLKGWDGDPKFWRAEGGAIVGQTTPDNKLEENTFIIWRGGEPGDFELKLEYRISSTNSGIQIRSTQLPQGSPDGRGGSIKGKWVLKGYQCDIDFENRYTGQIYEERGRAFLAMRGQMNIVTPAGEPKVLGALQVGEDDLKNIIKNNDWNQVHVIARGNRLVEILNGHVTSILVDEDAKGRALSGLMGFQMHVGEPMKVEFRNIYLRTF